MGKLFKNGTIIDYASNTEAKMDILVEDEEIVKIGENIPEEDHEIIDCTGLYIMPGMIDMHCHLREPGGEHKETIETGSKSAVKGGYTSICPMPNTKPTPDNPETLKYILDRARDVNLCNIFPYSSVTKGEKGEELVDFTSQLEAGAIAFSDDGQPVVNSALFREAMFKANEAGSFLAEHCEEKCLYQGAINVGEVQEQLGVAPVYPESEEIMAARDIVLAETNKLHTHLCHISTETSVNMVRAAKARGVHVTAETCVHHFSFNVEEVLNSGVNAKMNPPLREEKDRLAIIKGLQDGTIDAIVTDHAPHAEEEKAKGLASAPNGIIGFETSLAATITNLIKPGFISYLDMVRLYSYTPAKLLGLATRGSIKEGYLADLTIFDPDVTYTYTKDSIVSKSKNSPWIGKELTGQVAYTVVGGRIVYSR